MAIIEDNLEDIVRKWFYQSLDDIVKNQSSRKLFMAYTLCATKIEKKPLKDVNGVNKTLFDYLFLKEANLMEVSRITLLAKVLKADPDVFTDKIKKLIQIADTGELETFLKFLVLLPNPKEYQFMAVEALRTNISTIFDAITLDNPYPSLYFNEQQWNQMYLKAAFMQRNLGKIVGTDKRANQELARIISDYAHERWAASREIDPEIWRPVSYHMNSHHLKDMEHLFGSENALENKAATLVCYSSSHKGAKNLLKKYPKYLDKAHNKSLTWENFKV
nr:EboA domain-containing protein [Allomuricauda sp.]